jgi:polysaccharide biosynthesis PFTS motif protein
MLSESLKLTRVRLAKRGQLAKDYLFHNSGPFYRPLWTYEAEKEGARILFYFYSTNSESPKMGKSCPVQYPWHLMSWPYYLVWDKYQANFIKRVERHNSIIEEVGVIWFSSCAEELPIVEQKSITVFDVTPMRAGYYIALGAYAEFYVPIVVNQFLNDIQEVLTQNNYTMVHKMKRTNVNTHKKYSYNIKALRKKSNYQQVHPDLDATQLIQKSAATISMPFTSTALIARQEGKLSAYYDPSGMIQKDGKEAHDIPVLSGIKELKEWVRSIRDERFDK